MKEYKEWLEKLENINANDADDLKNMSEDDKKEAFGDMLSFGTSGMRGIMGLGTNRMNTYMINRLTKAMAAYILNNYKSWQDHIHGVFDSSFFEKEGRTPIYAHKRPLVLLGYDSRHNSFYYAHLISKLLKAKGIDALLYPHAAPVAMLTFLVRKLGAAMGIMITASHNPKIFNGYKVYNYMGYQISADEVAVIKEHIEKEDYFTFDIDISSFAGNEKKWAGKMANDDELKKEFDYIPMENYQIFTDHIVGLLPDTGKKDLKIVYTPLNGVGLNMVKEVLKRRGFDDFKNVKIQSVLDGDFPTCPSPNPEIHSVFDLSFKLRDEIDGDICLATDPDSDRIGVGLVHNGEKVIMKGNHMAMLMIDYMARAKGLSIKSDADKETWGNDSSFSVDFTSQNPILIRSVVSNPLVDVIANSYGASVVKTLTGFKHMCKVMNEMEEHAQLNRFLFAFEESIGYLCSNAFRDKDGVSGAMLVAEIAQYYKNQGKDLVDAVDELFERYGVLHEDTKNYFFEGVSGKEKMKSIMKYMRENIKTNIGNYKIKQVTDFLPGEILPSENLLQFDLEGGDLFFLRPSGTEPKLKMYVFSKTSTDGICKAFEDILETLK